MTVDQELLAADQQARDLALDISRSFIVQAPAGSGKTELLIQRYLKLLAVVSAPEEVLAITFTRKAAAEMQVRVLRALRAVQDGEQATAPHEQITAQAAQDVLAHDLSLSWNLLENPQRMRIQTLDSLNASIARSQPLTASGGAAETSIVVAAEMRSLYKEAAALTLDQLAEPGELQTATRQVLTHLDTNAGLYIAHLSRMLATRDQWLSFIGSGQLDSSESAALRAQLEAGLEQAITGHLHVLTEAVRTIDTGELLSLARYAGENLAEDHSSISRLRETDSVPGASPDAMAEWEGIAELLLTQQGGYRKTVNKNQGFPPGDDGQKARFGDLLESLCQNKSMGELLHDVRSLPPVAYTDDQWHVLLALFRLLPLAATELKRLFAERSVSDHIEVALSANNAIGSADSPGDVALLLDYQIQHVLVDEMQDTSSAQYRMIEALTGGWTDGDGRTLYCVGDPMQSIYRFRNAEVGQFLLSQEAGIGDVDLETLTLRRNFRSGQHLVEWFNEVFPAVFAPRDDPQRSAVSYEAAISVPALAEQGECIVHPVLGSDAAAEAEVGLEALEQLLESDNDGDIAVLVRSRSHLPELLYRLRKRGIPYRAIEIDRLTDLPEIIDALALTRALVHQGDRHAWLALLRSPWAGLDWTDLHALASADTAATVWELMANDEVKARLSDSGRKAVERLDETLAPVVNSCRAETLRARVERTWIKLGGPAILDEQHAVDNVYHFFDVVESLEIAGDLSDVGELEDLLDAEHVSRNVDARLQVMTMHRAKGLQFDHVMLFGLGRIPRPPEYSVLSWFDIPDRHGQPLKVISPVGPRGEIEKNPIHSYINSVEAAKDKNELARLLYVACTRARQSLHLVGSARLLKSGIRPDRRSLLYLLWPFVEAEFEQCHDPGIDTDESDDDSEWLQPRLRRFHSGWRLPDTPSSPVHREFREKGATPVEFYWVGAGARMAGTLVHRWIQRAVDGQQRLEELDDDAMRDISARWLREMGVTGDSAAPILSRVVEAIGRMAADEKGRWLLQGDGQAELALSGIVDGQLESVIIDRVRVDDDNVHWIVDYKTSSHEGGNLDDFIQAETDRYRLQLTKYAEIYRNYSAAEVRCALYFPLLQEFVEVTL